MEKNLREMVMNLNFVVSLEVNFEMILNTNFMTSVVTQHNRSNLDAIAIANMSLHSEMMENIAHLSLDLARFTCGALLKQTCYSNNNLNRVPELI